VPQDLDGIYKRLLPFQPDFIKICAHGQSRIDNVNTSYSASFERMEEHSQHHPSSAWQDAVPSYPRSRRSRRQRLHLSPRTVAKRLGPDRSPRRP